MYTRSPWMEAYVAYSVGYFWYDLILMHYPGLWSASMFVHHVMGAFFIPSVLVRPVAMAALYCTVLGAMAR